MSQGKFLELIDLSAAYGKSAAVVSDINFSLNEGELGCLLGPSGCGKTTILRAISGFQSLSNGSISLAGDVLSTHNIGFGLNKLDRAERDSRIATLLELVGMQTHEKKYPHELSGGQSQRVALARAIAPRPRLLLMDEPFSNLDAELRESLGYEVRSLLKVLGITAIMVTHDQNDAFALGDRIGVMSEGKLMQWDSSFNLYHAPNSRFVANFIGDGIFVKGQIVSENAVTTNFGEIRGTVISVGGAKNEIDVLIRPDDVKYNADSPIKGEVKRKAFKGAQTLYTIETESGDNLVSLVPSHDDYNIGDIIGVEIDTDHLVCFEQQ